MKRCSILSLMGIVLAAAITIAALRNADDYWAGGLLLATPMLLAVSLIAAICGRERPRARRLGFAILGGGYFALTFLGLTEPNLARLPTTWLLAYVHERVAPPALTSSVGTFTLSVINTQGAVVGTNSNSPLPGFTPLVTPGPPPGTAQNRWARLLPGAANFAAFNAVGHCLFALLAGLVGAAIAHWAGKGGGDKYQG